MGAPEISLIIRYSRPETIGQALKSVRDQCWLQPRVAIELVIIDALGRTESYQKLCEIEPALRTNISTGPVLIGEGLSLRWISSARTLTRAEALQVGIDNVLGRLTMFLDDDDTYDPNHIEKLYYGFQAATDQDRRIIAASTGVRLIRAVPSAAERFEIINLYDAPIEEKQLILSNALPLIGFICYTDSLRKCSVDTELEIYEDWDLLLQMLQIGSFVHLPGITANYFLSPAGSGVHHGVLNEEGARRVRFRWMKKLKNVDFEKMRHDLAMTERLTKENIVLATDLLKCKAAVEHYRRLHELMSQSISWKITSPLRKLKRLFRRITEH